MKYTVTIKEELIRDVEVEANNEEEAIEKIEEQYHNEEIVLDSEDFNGEPDIFIRKDN